MTRLLGVQSIWWWVYFFLYSAIDILEATFNLGDSLLASDNLYFYWASRFYFKYGVTLTPELNGITKFLSLNSSLTAASLLFPASSEYLIYWVNLADFKPILLISKDLFSFSLSKSFVCKKEELLKLFLEDSWVWIKKLS